MTCPICGQTPCRFDVPMDSPEIWALKRKNYRLALEKMERAMEGKPVEKEEDNATQEVRR
jgi:hypothetical protein